MAELINYNPDVLSCLANLSNDEVFTPPEIANKIIDLLPQNLFENKNTTFLDPGCKSGIFLREIGRRLLKGLEKEIPNKQERINHIYTKQLYALPITELTSLLSRRSIYCSKKANGKYSITQGFDNEQGNILFKKTNHTWVNGRCTFCGASENVNSRDSSLEAHAYSFLHTSKPKEIFNMKFDVIISNPPYQLSTGGSGVQAVPIYNKFVDQAKKLNPRYIAMVIPARWFSGGFGLDGFRKSMLDEKKIREIHDFPEAMDVFPGVQIKGGVCYFLWDSNYDGECVVTTNWPGKRGTPLKRPLLENGFDYFIRYNEAVSIIKKISAFNELTMDTITSSQKPFGLGTAYTPRKDKKSIDDIKVYGSTGIGFCSIDDISINKEHIDNPKVFIAAAGSGSDKFPHPILGKPITPELRSVCTETYIFFASLKSQQECKNLKLYISTTFFRFLVMLLKPTQHALKKVYRLVPIQDFSEEWSDEKLFKKYNISSDEIAFIDSLIRPMEIDIE
jgi:site-specific DNA-methyltransferase (adenine-specific)